MCKVVAELLWKRRTLQDRLYNGNTGQYWHTQTSQPAQHLKNAPDTESRKLNKRRGDRIVITDSSRLPVTLVGYRGAFPNQAAAGNFLLKYVSKTGQQCRSWGRATRCVSERNMPTHIKNHSCSPIFSAVHLPITWCKCCQCTKNIRVWLQLNLIQRLSFFQMQTLDSFVSSSTFRRLRPERVEAETSSSL